MESVAKTYAESLFSLAVEENKVTSYADDMSLVYAVFHEDNANVSFFSHVLIQDDVKFDLIDKSFKGQINQYIVNFLKLLIQKRRFRYILEICKNFQKLCNEYLGIEEGILYTGFILSDAEVASVEKAISKKENKTIQLHQVIDRNLIGGIKVQIENRVYDGSIQNRVEVLRRELLRK